MYFDTSIYKIDKGIYNLVIFRLYIAQEGSTKQLLTSNMDKRGVLSHALHDVAALHDRPGGLLALAQPTLAYTSGRTRGLKVISRF